MRATLQQYKDFVESALWMDLREVLLLKRSAVRDALEAGDPNGEKSAGWEDRERGRADELRFLADYPQYVVDNFESLVKEEENE